MKRVLLLSTSTVFGTRYLDHAATFVEEHFAGVEEILFVPYALKDHDAYAATVRKRFAELGRRVTSIHETPDPATAVNGASGIFVGGGNTFRLLATVAAKGLLAPIRTRVLAGLPYMGSSAGTNLACPTIRTTNDMPIVTPPSLDALALVPFQINPHYQDPEPNSRHMGETREQRIKEYHEENASPVVGLREGAILQVRDDHVTLVGVAGARVFRRGQDPIERKPGERVDDLLG